MRAEHTIPVALLFALACQGESKPLGRPDPSTGDASHPDAAIGDAGARDGGPRDAGPSAGFEYLVLERVPWGSRRTRYMRTTHLLGEASPNVEVEIFDSDDPAAAPIATGAADEDGRLDVTVPDTIVDAFVSAGGGARVPVVDERWVATFGPGTNPHSAYFTPAPFSSRRLHAAIRDRVALDDRAALARVDDDALSAVGEPIFEFESAGPDPGAFIASAFAYDSARRRLFLFGGVNGAPRRGSDETWVHDGTRWSRLDTEGLHPPPRQNAAMAYNPITERIVLVGGQSGSVRLDDTWIHDGTQWRELHTAKTPCRGDGPVATFDAARSRIALFAPGCGHLELVGDTWVERPTDLDVSAVFELAYDRDAEELVLLGLGGRGLTTYSYDVVGRDAGRHGAHLRRRFGSPDPLRRRHSVRARARDTDLGRAARRRPATALRRQRGLRRHERTPAARGPFVQHTRAVDDGRRGVVPAHGRRPFALPARRARARLRRGPRSRRALRR